MIQKLFGPQKYSISAIGQGTWQMPEFGDLRNEAILSLKRGMELGMLHIDTAELYAGAEELTAKAIKGLPRQELFIVSKVLPSHASFHGTIHACESSLQKLGIDYLDCYLLHWRGSIPLQETMQALEQLVADGKIRSLGVSNFDIDDLEEAESYLEKEKIACNQVLYNLGERGIERRLVPYCRAKQISIVGYTPFALLPPDSTAKDKILQNIATKYNATVRQVVLAYLIRDNLLFAIPKAAHLKHTEENAGAADLTLDQTDIDQIDKAFPD